MLIPFKLKHAAFMSYQVARPDTGARCIIFVTKTMINELKVSLFSPFLCFLFLSIFPEASMSWMEDLISWDFSMDLNR